MHLPKAHRRRKAVAAVLGAGMIAGVWQAMPASAKITTPVNGATVRGEVLINEDRGGASDSLCETLQLVGAPKPSSTITVTRLADNKVVHQKTLNDGGGWSTVWDSRGELANGFFRLRSVATDRRFSLAGGFCYGGVTTTLSDIKVYLENFTPFVDDRGAGTILVNPFLKMFRFTAPGYDSGNKSDPNMTFVNVPGPAAPSAPCDPTVDPTACAPGAPGLPSVHPACADPTAASFLPFVLREGPQGCISPNPVPPIEIPPSVPNPPSPPDPNAPPPSPQCGLPATAGCTDTIATIGYHDDSITVSGVFNFATRAFGASVATQPQGNAYVLSHSPPPPSA